MLNQSYRLAKKKDKDSKKISLLISSLLMYLVESNNLLFTKIRSIKKIRISKEIHKTIINKNKVKAKIFL